jgi:hypothetical protein
MPVAFAGGGGTVTQSFLAKVAVTDAERARDLMYRQSGEGPLHDLPVRGGQAQRLLDEDCLIS